MAPIRRARECPHVGCSQWAMFAIEQDVVDGEVVLWRCGAGHHGLHVFGDRGLAPA